MAIASQGVSGARPPTKPECPLPVFTEQRHRAQLLQFSLRHSIPTFAINISSWRRFYSNMSILRITLGKKSHFSIYHVFCNPKVCKMRFRSGQPRTLLGSSQRSSRPPIGWRRNTRPHPTQRLRRLDPCASAQARCPYAALGLATALYSRKTARREWVTLRLNFRLKGYISRQH